MRDWTLPALALTTALVLGCGSGEAARNEAAPRAAIAVDMTAVVRKDLRETAALDGFYSFAPGSFARLAPAEAGRLVSVNVSLGDRIRRGQVLARIDQTVLRAQESGAQAGAMSSRQQAVQAQAALQAAQRGVESQIQTARVSLQAAVLERDSSVKEARTELDRVLSGARPQEIGQAEQAVQQAKVTRDQARMDADRDQALLKEGYVSGQQAQASHAACLLAESALKQAQQQLELVRLGARPEEVQAARLRLESAQKLGDKKVEAAQDSLKQARQGRESLSVQKAEAAAARMGARQQAAAAAAAAGALANGEIRAPFDGVVTRRLLNPGDSADPATPVIEAAREGSRIEFSGSASSDLAGRLREGMTVSAADSTDVLGRIASVGVADPQTGQCQVRIVLSRPPSGARSGQFARLTVVLKSLPGAASVPDECVVDRDSKKYILIVQGGEARLKEVKIGPSDRGFTVLLTGAAVGETVVKVGQHELSDGAKVKPAGSTTVGVNAE